MFCQRCGNHVSESSAFCSECGAKIQQSNGSLAPQESPNVQQLSLVGFSSRYNHPEILAAAQKNRKTFVGCAWILVFVPLIGFPIAGLLMDDFPLGEAVVVGGVISLVMLAFNLFFLRSVKKPIWDGTVVNQYNKKRYENRVSEESSTTYTEYTTVIKTDAGKKKTIVEKDSRRFMYDYLSVGDRVRFHPMFSTYEKFDKSKDRIIYCNVMMNSMNNDRCERCKNLLFK